MKYLLILIFFSSTVCFYGQSGNTLAHLIQSWAEGEIDQNGTVVQSEAVDRGGRYHLKISSDSVIFSDPFTCGFGYKRLGTWSFNETDRSLTFVFSIAIGYMNTPGATKIDVTEIHRIDKLTPEELILVQTINGQEKILAFNKAKK